MNYLEIVKRKGPKGLIQTIGKRLFNPINHAIFRFASRYPIDNSLIIFESDGDLSDNSFAFFDYLVSNGYDNKFKMIWLVDNKRKSNRNYKIHIATIKKRAAFINPRRSILLAICKFYIYDHNNILGEYGRRPEQRIINLWHGCSFKRGTVNENDQAVDTEEIMTVTGDFWKPIMAKFVGCNEKKVISLGYPRNDYLFQENDKAEEWFLNEGWLCHKKCFLWMPTFRQSNVYYLSEEYYCGNTGLPLFEYEKDMIELDEFLYSKDVLIIFKVHHLQLEYPAFSNTYKSIIILKDSEIARRGLQLYQVINQADAMITDYSAVFDDFLMLDRPMIFTIDDYEDYKKSRGFSIEEPRKFYPGYQVTTKEEIYRAIDEIASGIDYYDSDRRNMISIMHNHCDGNSSRRIADYLGL